MKYDDRGNLFVDVRSYIPARHVRNIRQQLNRGVKWPEASALYPVTREQFAFIVTNEPPVVVA